jgi:hypothetical protein
MRMDRRLLPFVVAAGVLAACGSENEVPEPDAGPSAAEARRLDQLERRADRLERQLAEAQTRTEDEAGGLLDNQDLADFEQFAATLGGQVGMTVGAVGDPGMQQLGALTTGAAWSTIKVPIALRVIDDAGGPSRLSEQQRSEVSAALTASDNAAAMNLWNGLSATHGGVEAAASAVTEVLRAAGDETTVVSTQGRAGFSPYGQTEWSLEAQHRFMSALAGGCLADPETTSYLFELMSNVTPSQRWGLGSSSKPSLLKGGWGPEAGGGYLVRQMGVLGYDPKRGGAVVTLAALASDAAFASGTALLDELTAWLDQHLPAQPPVAAPC